MLWGVYPRNINSSSHVSQERLNHAAVTISNLRGLRQRRFMFILVSPKPRIRGQPPSGISAILTKGKYSGALNCSGPEVTHNASTQNSLARTCIMALASHKWDTTMSPEDRKPGMSDKRHWILSTLTFTECACYALSTLIHAFALETHQLPMINLGNRSMIISSSARELQHTKTPELGNRRSGIQIHAVRYQRPSP